MPPPWPLQNVFYIVVGASAIDMNSLMPHGLQQSVIQKMASVMLLVVQVGLVVEVVIVVVLMVVTETAHVQVDGWVGGWIKTRGCVILRVTAGNGWCLLPCDATV